MSPYVLNAVELVDVVPQFFGPNPVEEKGRPVEAVQFVREDRILALA